jgi:uncharacterized protein YndB with AHSA1/START domain
MKYADCPVVEVDVLVESSAEMVWALVTDIDLPARFSKEFLGGTWLDGAERPAVGARFEGRNHHPAVGEWKSTSTVVACEPGRVLAWAVGDPETPSATWRFELTPEAGGTRLRQRAQMGPGPSGLTPAIQAMPDKEERIVAGRLEEWRRNMMATVEGIKALAEA